MNNNRIILTFISLVTSFFVNAQLLSTSPGFSIETVITDSIIGKYDTLVQVNLILQLDDKLLKDVVKVHVTATKEFGSLRKKTAVYNLEKRPLINDYSYIKKVDAVLDNKVKIKDLKSKELVYSNTIESSLSADSDKTKDKKSETTIDTLKVKNKTITIDTLRLTDRVFIYAPLRQIKINFGQYRIWESNFNFILSLEDKNGKLTLLDATKKSVKKKGVYIYSKDL